MELSRGGIVVQGWNEAASAAGQHQPRGSDIKSQQTDSPIRKGRAARSGSTARRGSYS